MVHLHPQSFFPNFGLTHHPCRRRQIFERVSTRVYLQTQRILASNIHSFSVYRSTVLHDMLLLLPFSLYVYWDPRGMTMSKK